MTRRIKVALVAASLALGLAAAAGAVVHHSKAGGTLVFAGASDPVVLDGPLVSDGESLRPIDQIFEGLVGLKPGTTQVVPKLAISWKATPNGLAWNFALRRNVNRQVRLAGTLDATYGNSPRRVRVESVEPVAERCTQR